MASTEHVRGRETVKARKERERQEAADTLREFIKPGSTVYTVLRRVSPSGMTRWIDLYVMQDGEPRWISSLAARVIDETFDRQRECIKVGGSGMDMGFHLVYSLGRVLYRGNFLCSGEPNCPANDHVNERGAERKAGYRIGRKHSDAGYALNHRWL